MITDSSKVVVSDGQVEARPPRGLIALAFGFLILDFLPQGTFGVPLHIPGTHWNWSGKAISIAFSCVLLAYSPWLRQNVGLRRQQANGSLRLSLICLFACIGYGIAGGFLGAPWSYSLEALLFQGFLTPINEELSNRGIGLALLERGFGQSPMSCRLRYGWAAFVLSLFFGLGHGIQFRSHDGVTVLYIPFLWTFMAASIFALVRTRSGSLLWPMLCHSAINVAVNLTAMMR